MAGGILAGGLAELRRGAGHVQNVIDDCSRQRLCRIEWKYKSIANSERRFPHERTLESHANLFCKLFACSDVFLACSSDDRPRRTAHLQCMRCFK